MRTVMAPRASAILYDLLVSQVHKRPYLLPANICPIVPLTFFKANVPFEFADISPKSLSMDLQQAEERLGARGAGYGGLLYAHAYGNPSTPQDFFKMVKDRYPELLLIDDRCLCIPDLQGRPSSNADVTLYSTGEAKFVELSYGGFAFLAGGAAYHHQTLSFDFRDLEALENSYERNIERGVPYSYHDSNWLETDSDLPSWSEYAALVRTGSKESLAHRKSVNAVYEALLPADMTLAEDFQLWRFNVRVPDKAKTLNAIFDAQLFASSHYACLSGIMGTGRAPVAQELASKIINLFNDRHYTVDMAERTAQIVLGSL